MATNVTLTAALRANLLSLQGTAKLLDQTQIRLSTGKKVNSALDNPSAFFAAKSLTNRASDLSNLLDSMGQSIQTLKAADQGLTSLTSLVEQAKAIANTARSQVQNSGLARSGDMSAAVQADLTAGDFDAGDDFTVSVAGTVAGTITITAGMTLGQLAASLNSISGVSAQIVDGTNGATATNKRLEIRATNGQTLTLTNITAGALDGLINNNGGTGGSTGVRGDTYAALASGAAIASSANVLDQISLEGQYRTVRTEIDNLVRDSGYQGVNLLNGDNMTVQFNETNSSKLTVTGVTYNSSGLGLSFTAGSTFRNQTNVDTAINQISAALNSIRTQASTFGNNLNIVQTRQDFTSNLINNLKAGSDLLTLADTNEEGANLLALQTSQQLGIQALSLASQANQSVLRLFA